MKLLAKQNRELIMINPQNTQNENDTEKITLQVPEQYEDFNKKIVFVTPDGNVWDIITNNEYLIKKAITKYEQVDFYIWLTKGDVDFRSQTKTLKFYHNVDASGEITPEEISGVNTVVNLLEEEITKVNNLETEIDGKLEEIDTAIDNLSTAIQETENLDLDAEKVGQTTTITLTKKDGTVKTVHVDDGEDGEVTETELDVLRQKVANQQKVIDQLPQVSGEGESVTLNNTIKAPFTKFDIEGHSEQETTEGYNFLPPSSSNISGTKNGLSYTVYKDGSILLNGTTTEYTEIQYTSNKTIPAGTYTFTNSLNTGDVSMYFWNTNETWQFNNFDVKTRNSDYPIVPIIFQVPQGKTFNNVTIKPMLVKGSYTSSTIPPFEKYTNGASPNPSYEQPIKSAGDNGSINEKIKNADGTEEQNYSIPVQQPMRSIGDVRDSFVKINGVWNEKHLPYIASYNGETLPTDVYTEESGIKYCNSKSMSTTGQFSNGASVQYVDENNWNYLPCTEEQIQQLENIPSTYKDFTIIQSQDETEAYLEVSGIYDLNNLINN